MALYQSNWQVFSVVVIEWVFFLARGECPTWEQAVMKCPEYKWCKEHQMQPIICKPWKEGPGAARIAMFLFDNVDHAAQFALTYC